jgi:hypothetical protein
MAFYLTVLNTRAEKFTTVGAINMQNNDSACTINLRVMPYTQESFLNHRVFGGTCWPQIVECLRSYASMRWPMKELNMSRFQAIQIFPPKASYPSYINSIAAYKWTQILKGKPPPPD